MTIINLNRLRLGSQVLENTTRHSTAAVKFQHTWGVVELLKLDVARYAERLQELEKLSKRVQACEQEGLGFLQYVQEMAAESSEAKRTELAELKQKAEEELVAKTKKVDTYRRRANPRFFSLNTINKTMVYFQLFGYALQTALFYVLYQTPHYDWKQEKAEGQDAPGHAKN